ncbi:MAG: lumazine-binding protein [Actinomycetia bacterium]|nr:lumazine-binding protein [Actinomycetes bacterium]
MTKGSDSSPSDSSSAGPTAAPFLIALTIAMAVVGATWLFNAFSSDELTGEQRIWLAVVAQNDALQRQDYAEFREHTCQDQQESESEIVAQHSDSVARRGERFVDGVTGIAVDGDRATAEVTYHFSQNPEAKEKVEIPFARQDGTWKVCSTGPN